MMMMMMIRWWWWWWWLWWRWRWWWLWWCRWWRWWLLWWLWWWWWWLWWCRWWWWWWWWLLWWLWWCRWWWLWWCRWWWLWWWFSLKSNTRGLISIRQIAADALPTYLGQELGEMLTSPNHREMMMMMIMIMSELLIELCLLVPPRRGWVGEVVGWWGSTGGQVRFVLSFYLLSTRRHNPSRITGPSGHWGRFREIVGIRALLFSSPPGTSLIRNDWPKAEHSGGHLSSAAFPETPGCRSDRRNCTLAWEGQNCYPFVYLFFF